MAENEAYRLAEKKIEEALRTGAKKLKLSGKRGTKELALSSLPESLRKLEQLESLQLADNRLTSLPEWIGELTQLQTLELSYNQLTVLPESLGQLTQLQTLNLYNNELTALSASLGQLTQLQTLDLSSNDLTALPESLGQLTQLQTLQLWMNKLVSLPKSLGQLENLTVLSISVNRFSSLPECIPNVRSLRELYAIANQIEQLPNEIGDLKQLQILALGGSRISDAVSYMDSEGHGNRLQTLPQSLADLNQLQQLHLNNNALDPELAAAYGQGLDAVKAYLREKAKGTKKRYEAKLLVLGDGNEGKTCVSRALRELPFETQLRTRGVDVEQWTFPHPDDPDNKEREITLNIWDFEGQEINHQTHQFFLTTESLYLLVFKCRDQFLLDRAEYWLDTIRARAPEAKVAIVVTECEQSTPYVPEDKLQSEYGDILVGENWLFAVGCEDNSGIPRLQESLMRWAADLRFMGRDWPESYSEAEIRITEDAEGGTAHVGRAQLYDVFQVGGIDEPSFKDVATSLATLGIITQFPDCPDLTDFIVLQPQWLTKAISHIMEDKPLAEAKGEITFERMQQIWETQGHKELFPVFHDCMKEFELCYDLEDQTRCCLVPLRFGYKKPTIVWTDGPNMKERRVQYKLDIRPPLGLMSRFIVKTHHMIAKTDAAPRGVYWHNGVFLRTGEGPLCSEALCEFDQDARTLSVQVRAAFPQNMIEQIHAYVKAVFAFFSGLEPVRSFGCIEVDEATNAETQCAGVHSEKRISFAMESREKVACEEGRHHVDPMQLIWGISSFGTDIAKLLRQELDKQPTWAEPLMQNIGTLLNWADEHQQTLQQLQTRQANLIPEIRQEMELKLREYLGYMSDMLDQRHQTSAPSLFSLNTVSGSVWSPKSYFRQKYVLTPYCECEGNIHRHDEGKIEFSKNKQWWDATAPWIARGTKVLAVGLQLAFAGMPMTLGDQVYDVIKNDVAFMNELTRQIEFMPEADTGDDDILQLADRATGQSVEDLRGSEKETTLMRAALIRFLEELAPDNYRARQWGQLKRTRMADNSYRWLCEDCVRRVKR